jgi:ribonuclease HI
MIEIYCDGAYSSKRNMGGWAIVVLDSGKKIFSNFFPVEDTTNNRMELQAVIEACAWAHNNFVNNFTIFSDSMYVIGTVTLGWKRKKNTDLWNILDNYIKNANINWEHVKGHSGNKYNDLCDALAVQASLVTS